MIVARHITKVFHRDRGFLVGDQPVRAVDDVSLSLGEQEFFGLVGQSGSGKTTLGMILCGALLPTSGEVAAEGLGRALRSQMIFQDARESLDPRMRVHELIAEPLTITGLPGSQRRQRVHQLVAELQLHPSLLQRYPHELSGGQQQRVAIARAVIAHPDIVIADEPTSMLDPTAAKSIVELLKKLRQTEHIAILFISHDLAQAAGLCDRIGVMHAGKLVEVGLPRQVSVSPKSEPARALAAAARARESAVPR